MSSQLEISNEEFRKFVDLATHYICKEFENVDHSRAETTETAKTRARRLIEPPPAAPENFERLLHFLFNDALPDSISTQARGYLAYIPGGGLPHAAIADLIANAINRYVGLSRFAPSLVQIESNVIRWFSQWVGYDPSSARGFLTSGGSIANLSAIFVARAQKEDFDPARLRVYYSNQAHFSVAKAAKLGGFRSEQLVPIESDANFKLSLSDLEKHLERDAAEGLVPTLIVGSAGTTNTGAVDNLVALSQLSRRFGAWFHIDAAYGGFFILTERGKKTFQGMELADSITLDPHKGLFLPYGTGALLCRSAEPLRKAFQVKAEYIPQFERDPDLWDFSEFSPEMSRDFRGLRVWLPLKMHGVGAFTEQLNEKLDLTQIARNKVAEIPHVKIISEPELSLFTFQLAPPELSSEERNKINEHWIKNVNARGNIFLSGTWLRGEFVLRICVLSFRTDQKTLEKGLFNLKEEAHHLTAV